ncbi:response regulator transcription factor [Paenibacillus nasutitermitis]|uniref:Response regulator n=1 Tax=Paenibacillus nasutitermitis TaxID=1652958 RepID=A0A917DMQ5_9BACL|nr:response regulator [Paenibacillus nasutitermitis]GGD53332.1 hypothetical protein GCM10010911_08630 [Paenibacillus nasutitermitis]
MPTIMVIDDEVIIRKGIVSIIRRLAPSWEICECTNAQSAIEQLAVDEPDLMLIDINMPGMDGLELAHYLKMKYPDILKIILTGHDKFSYVQNALRAEVLDYLLKPIIREELLKALEKAEHLIAERMVTAQQEAAARRQKLQQSLEWLLCGVDVPEDELKQLLAGNGWSFNGTELSLLLLIGEADGFAIQEEKLLHLVADYKTLFMDVEDAFAFFADSQHFFLISSGTSLPAERIKGWWLEAWLPGEPDSYSLLEFRLAPIAAVSSSFSSWSELPGIYGKMIQETYRSVNAQKQLHSIYRDNDWNEQQKRFRIALEMNDSEGVSKFLEESVAEIKRHAQTSPSIVLSQMFRFMLLELMPLLNKTESRFSLALRQTLAHMLASLSSPGSSLHLMSILHEFENEIRMMTSTQTDSLEKNKVIKVIKEYIGKNYSDQSLKLEALSKIVHMNANYLSDLFKEVTGENYLAYLTSVRMNHAKKLLRETHLKTYEIGDQIGYSSAKYFCKLFRQQFGMTPTDYRNRADHVTDPDAEY